MATAYSRKRRCNRKSNRRSRRNLYGGSASINDTSMESPSRLSVAQGNQFTNLTKNMHGGVGTYPSAVTDSVLPQNLHPSARLVALDRSYNEIVGMKDQAGGRKRRNRKSKKSKKSKKSRKNRKASRKSRKSRRNRKSRGGALGYASVSAPGMLLDAKMTAEAGLNPEWKLAENPDSFAPTKA